MERLFDQITKVLPQPLLVSFLIIGGLYFAVFYSTYRSHTDALRDTKFLSGAVIIVAAALLYMINKKAPLPTEADVPPILIVPKFVNDDSDRCRAPFIATVEAKLDALTGRSGSVHKVRSFVTTHDAALLMLDEYKASAVLYDASVSNTDNASLICFRLLTGAKGPAPRIPPIPLRSLEDKANSLVNAIVPNLLLNKSTLSNNPLLSRIGQIEKELETLSLELRESRLAEATPTAPNEFENRFAVVVGLNQFQNSEFQLRFCEKDAIDTNELLKQQGFETTLLLGTQATRSAILGALADIANRSKANDLVIFYFAGNGINTSQISGQSGGLIPYDFHNGSNVLPNPELIKSLGEIEAASRLAVVDACHAALQVEAKFIPDQIDGDLLFLAGCGPEGVTYEGPNGGVFTQALLAEYENAIGLGDSINIAKLFRSVALQLHQGGYDQMPILISLAGSDNLVIRTLRNANTLPQVER